MEPAGTDPVDAEAPQFSRGLMTFDRQRSPLAVALPLDK